MDSMRIAAGLTIVVAHAMAIYIAGEPKQVGYRPENSSAFTVTMINSRETRTPIALPVQAISALSVRLDVLPAPITKADATPETRASHFQPASIDSTRPIKPFSANRGELYRARPSATIILLIEVRADGSVGDVEVKASSGNSQIDAAAVAYVGNLRWKPALREGSATTMRILYSVTT